MLAIDKPTQQRDVLDGFRLSDVILPTVAEANIVEFP